MTSRSYTFDAELEFKDAGAVTADGAAEVDGSAKIVDLGSETAAFSGVMICDVSAIKISANDELYTLIVQGGDADDFSGAIENLAELSLGATEVRPGGADDSTVGRYEIPFINEQDGTKYRYLRVYVDVAGTSPSINFTAFAGRASGPMMP
ncbi:MAG: hypothetical protein ACX94B_12990 [Henriciella sp.]